MSARTSRLRHAGFTLVELMIAMTLGLATVAAVGWVYLGTMQAYRTHDALSRLQEGARHAFEVIGKDVRMTGTTGCSYASTMNVMNNPTAWYEDLFGQSLISVAKNGTANTQTQYSDALRVLRADISREYIVQNHNSAASTFTLAAVARCRPLVSSWSQRIAVTRRCSRHAAPPAVRLRTRRAVRARH